MSRPKVTVVGAGQVGATTTFMLLKKGLCDVVLIDVAEGLPQGKALDMMHSRSVERFAPVVTGTNDYADTVGSQVVVVTAGLPRTPGMTREDLLAANAAIVRSVMERAVDASPDAVYVLVTNPLDVMVDLAWRVSGLPTERVLGMGGVLDSARFAYAIAEETGADVGGIEALVVGAHGEAMVPLPRLTTVNGTPITEILPAEKVDALVARTIGGGAEVVALLKTGSAFYAPAASIAAMLEAILGDTGAVLPSCVRLEGHYGIDGVYLSVPAALGARGVLGIPELDLTEAETVSLRASAATVAEAIVGWESHRTP
ncbi:MAG: malate dehydrogenase [Clostridiales bacterium]|nr:malate dehydrogenase [Clostridiales bacterium]